MKSKSKVVGLEPKPKPVLNKVGPLILREHLFQQYQEVGLDFPYDLADIQFTKCIKLGQDNMIRKVVSMQRRVHPNTLGDHKRTEYLTYLVDIIVPDTCSVEYMEGRDEHVTMKEIHGEDGTVHYRPTNKVQIFTIPFTGKKQVEEILSEYPDTDLSTIQFSIITGGAKGDFSLTEDEFKECSFEECKLRGQMGLNTNYPSSFSFSQLSTEKKLELTKGIKI